MSGTSTNGRGKGRLRSSARERNASSDWKIRTQGSCTLERFLERVNYTQWNP
uniref:Uncharacterized protein n=1 Tax=Arundo donax TaxID=35708 RepID=A0A0A9R1I6_ARUDO